MQFSSSHFDYAFESKFRCFDASKKKSNLEIFEMEWFTSQKIGIALKKRQNNQNPHLNIEWHMINNDAHCVY